MATEYKLSYTAAEINEKLGKVDELSDKVANIADPTDEQVSTAVSAWLDEHPEATTTVKDGSITPEKLSFYDDGLNYIDVSALTFDETISSTDAQALGMWYSGYLSNPIGCTGKDHVYVKETAKRDIGTGAFVGLALLFYDANDTLLAVSNTTDTTVLLIGYHATAHPSGSIWGIHIPDGASYVKFYIRYTGVNEVGVTAYFSLANMIPKKAWENDTTDEIKDQLGLIDGIHGNLLELTEGNYVNVKPSTFTGFYELPSDYSAIDTKNRDDLSIFLDPIQTRGFKDIYVRLGSTNNRANWEIYGSVGFLAYDADFNYLGQFHVEGGEAEGVASCELLEYVVTEAGVRNLYHIRCEDAVRYLFYVCTQVSGIGDIDGKCASYSPLKCRPEASQTASFDIPAPMLRRVEDAITDNNYYRFKQLGKLIDQMGVKYVAWNHNLMHYDNTRNKFVLAFRGSTAHGSGVNSAFFTTIEPLTYKSAEPVSITDGTNTVSWVNGFVLDDEDNYTLFCMLGTEEVYKFTSTDGGETWTNEGAITVDTSGAADADTATYNYKKFFNVWRMSDGTLLASYDDTVSKKDTTYGFIVRSVDGGLNWTLIEVNGVVSASCEQCFFEVDDTIISIGRKNTYNIIDRSKPHHAMLTYSTDGGVTWTAPVESDVIENHCQTCIAFEHDGIVEVLAMSRNYDTSGNASVGKINHYSCSKEEALNDGFKLREVFYSQSYTSSDFAGISLARDRYGNVLVAHSDSTPTASTITSPNFLVGANFTPPTPCCDGIASDRLPYSGAKIEEMFAALREEIAAT